MGIYRGGQAKYAALSSADQKIRTLILNSIAHKPIAERITGGMVNLATLDCKPLTLGSYAHD